MFSCNRVIRRTYLRHNPVEHVCTPMGVFGRHAFELDHVTFHQPIFVSLVENRAAIDMLAILAHHRARA